MGLREQAEADLAVTLEDNVTGFGWPITVTDPAGNTNVNPLYGSSDDIAQAIDPDTGVVVSGRLASVAIRISSLTVEGLGIPEGITDASLKPWVIEFEDVNGNPYTFKVQASNPDRAIGIVVCVLELYES